MLLTNKIGLSEKNQCDIFFESKKSFFKKMAKIKISEGFSPETFFIVCVDLRGPNGSKIAEKMIGKGYIPRKYWNHVRGEKEPFLAATFSTNNYSETLSNLDPNFADEFKEELPWGMVRVILLTESSVTVHHLQTATIN